MRRLLASGLAALAALIADAAPGRADIVIQVPFVTIRIPIRPGGLRGPRPTQPWQTAPMSEAPQVEPPPGVPLEIAPPAPPVPQVGQTAPTPAPTPAPAPGRLLTLQEFALGLRPTGGTCTVLVQHPCTGAPVAVTLTVPAGTPAVRIRRGLRPRVQLLYGRRQVEVVFLRNGRVRVHQ